MDVFESDRPPTTQYISGLIKIGNSFKAIIDRSGSSVVVSEIVSFNKSEILVKSTEGKMYSYSFTDKYFLPVVTPVPHRASSTS